MVSDLTALPIANASLLDEGTAAAEAMAMLFNHKNKDHDHITAPKFFVDEKIFKQTKDILITRAKPVELKWFLEILIQFNLMNLFLER